tara:strand:+ start:178 stop:417 length:240 start_codon:yes stop_codon:yes gene_type:complete
MKTLNLKTATKAELRQADIDGLVGQKVDLVSELKKVASLKSDVSILGELNIDFVDVINFSKEDLNNLWVVSQFGLNPLN